MDYLKIVEEAVRTCPAPDNKEVTKAMLGHGAFFALHVEALRAHEELHKAGRPFGVKVYWSESGLELMQGDRTVTFRLGADYSIGVTGSGRFRSHAFQPTKPQLLPQVQTAMARALRFLATGLDSNS